MCLPKSLCMRMSNCDSRKPHSASRARAKRKPANAFRAGREAFLWILHTFFPSWSWDCAFSVCARVKTGWKQSEATQKTQFQVNTTCQQNFKLNVFVHHLAQNFFVVFLILKQMCWAKRVCDETIFTRVSFFESFTMDGKKSRDAKSFSREVLTKCLKRIENVLTI